MSRADLSDERGGVLVFVALFLPLALLFSSFVIDLGNWWVHKRHLQTQADASALAGVGAIRFPCQDPPIDSLSRSYSGDRAGDRNPQVGGTQPDDIHMLMNSKTFYGQTELDPDPPPSTSPCTARMIDVKMTETDLPWFLRVANVDFINATARVAINQLDVTAGMLPVGVPDVNPKKAAVTFVDLGTGAVLGTRTLTSGTSSSGITYWSNTGNPLTLNVAADRIGVRVALSGSDSTTCGGDSVECYDAASTAGLVRIRTYPTTPAVTAGQPPKARTVFMLPGTCGDGYFTANTSACTVGVRASMEFAPGIPTTAQKLTAVVGGTSYAMTYDSVTSLWRTDAVAVAPASGPQTVDLNWEQTTGTVAGNTCTTTNGNKCKGTLTDVQRVFSAATARSGPIQSLVVSDQGGPYANSLVQGTSHDFVVTLGVLGSLAVGRPGDAPVVLRVGGGGSQNQTIDCDPGYSQLKDELANGCRPQYTRNTGQTCPAGASALWATAQPWNCAAIQTGQAANQVPAGLNTRILGTDKPSTCTSPNRWPDVNGDGQPDYNVGDPRIVPVFIVPFGSFQSSGSGTVPVKDFAFFYVTGWTGQGGGFNNPCQGNGDDPVPGNDPASIVGHFIKYVQNPNEGGSGQLPCDFDPNSLGGCVAVMTK